jgi:hypothetical protein
VFWLGVDRGAKREHLQFAMIWSIICHESEGRRGKLCDVRISDTFSLGRTGTMGCDLGAKTSTFEVGGNVSCTDSRPHNDSIAAVSDSSSGEPEEDDGVD